MLRLWAISSAMLLCVASQGCKQGGKTETVKVAHEHDDHGHDHGAEETLTDDLTKAGGCSPKPQSDPSGKKPGEEHAHEDGDEHEGEEHEGEDHDHDHALGLLTEDHDHEGEDHDEHEGEEHDDHEEHEGEEHEGEEHEGEEHEGEEHDDHDHENESTKSTGC